MKYNDKQCKQRVGDFLRYIHENAELPAHWSIELEELLETVTRRPGRKFGFKPPKKEETQDIHPAS